MIDHQAQIHKFLVSKDADALLTYTKANPEAVTPYREDNETPWLVSFVNTENYELAKAALDAGFPVDALRLPERWHALSTAISDSRLDLIQLLLSYGANCNLDRCILTAVRGNNVDFSLAALKLLLAHGLQLNRVFRMFDEPGTEFTVLDRVDEDSRIYTYLREHGAKQYGEM